MEKVSSVIEAVSTAFKHPEADQKDSETVVEASKSDLGEPESSAADTTDLKTTEAPASQVEETQAPTLLEQVSSIVEAVSTVFKPQEIEPQDSKDALEPTATEATAVDTVESLTTQAQDSDLEKTQAPKLSERSSSVVETVPDKKTSKSSKSQSKKKAKAKGFGGSKKNK
ncbi:MAG TPA: hypothetical protein DCP31_09395 [Cyanobacteria bacterium UBA8543]|nr:hypothetical protein [Cyanobacteria bacterium UBA8543]